MSTFETLRGPVRDAGVLRGAVREARRCRSRRTRGRSKRGTRRPTEGEDEQCLGDILGALTGEGEGPLSEAQEMELASELLEISSEEELEEFLGNLFKGVAKSVGGFIKSPIGKQLGGILKGVAKKALPVVGGALGSFVAPGVGTAIGSKLGSMASGLFEMETEGMSQEQAQFEVARRYVRLAASAAQHAATRAPQRATAEGCARSRSRRPPASTHPASCAARAPARACPPVRSRAAPAPGHRAVGTAAVAAASARCRRVPGRRSTVFVPGGNGDQASTTVQPSYGPPEWAQPEPYEPSYGTPAPQDPGRAQRGRWIRRGSKIVLYGV